MNIFGLGSGKTKTFRPKRGKKKRPGLASGAPDMGEFSFANLRADLRKFVVLPESQCEEEWLAVHTQDFFNLTNILYGTLSQYCTDDACPVMSAGPLYEYWWRDEVKKKAQQVSAPVYVDSLMQWIEDQMGDEAIFPSPATVADVAAGGSAASSTGGDAQSPDQELAAVALASNAFPPNFKSVVKKIFSRLFRVYGHIYHTHLQHIIALDQELHLNSVFLHLIFFIQEFKLVEKKELEPLNEVIDRLVSAADAETTEESSTTG
ncbi:uncharacterized protein AMSG_11298 [Thecamonas trahens ATCC 50062]|uniref:Uncharacterized protein n=1 Tax=Thecamonas trahens ATCC 50062 TaxID=461836 RepID=A0A0L0DU50_THETB|nr:hypothetical protein AMSG_11298 [Thecamonas trahens ATCC 50062]KNC55854.1 hypothetical protein AMSG_11298 [Thecamonas trahens ATCC 50062]|eukprot:XP_013752780.1 hypothetical protein AMSG_11298 [Thecamonas trahens ATCC 50062]